MDPVSIDVNKGICVEVRSVDDQTFAVTIRRKPVGQPVDLAPMSRAELNKMGGDLMHHGFSERIWSVKFNRGEARALGKRLVDMSGGER